MAKVTQIKNDIITFDNGMTLTHHHDADCCEHHYLDMKDITLKDFEGLEFDLTEENFFKRIKDYGIELVPLNGHSIKIPGYGYNNGYYSNQLDLILQNTMTGESKYYNITECQDESYG